MVENEIVRVEPIETDVQITGDHVVALLVSQVEENIAARDRDTQKQLNDVHKQIEDLNKQIRASCDTLRKSKEAELKKSPLLNQLKAIGIKATVAVDVTISSKENRLVYQVRINQPKRQTGCVGEILSAIPKNIATMTQKLASLETMRSSLGTQLLDLRSYRQNEIPSLERWARGQLAAQALEKAGGDMSKFVDKLTKAMPRSLQHLLSA